MTDIQTDGAEQVEGETGEEVEPVGIEVDQPLDILVPAIAIEGQESERSSSYTWNLPARQTHVLCDEYQRAIVCSGFDWRITNLRWTPGAGMRTVTSVHPNRTMANVAWKWSNAHQFQTCFFHNGLLWRLDSASGSVRAGVNPMVSGIEFGVNDTWMNNGYGDNTGGFTLAIWNIQHRQ